MYVAAGACLNDARPNQLGAPLLRSFDLRWPNRPICIVEDESLRVVTSW
jgi:hypothetical protein